MELPTLDGVSPQAFLEAIRQFLEGWPGDREQGFATLEGMSDQVFLEAVRQFLEGRPGDVGAAVFDKEDDLAVEFVTAANDAYHAAAAVARPT